MNARSAKRMKPLENYVNIIIVKKYEKMVLRIFGFANDISPNIFRKRKNFQKMNFRKYLLGKGRMAIGR